MTTNLIREAAPSEVLERRLDDPEVAEALHVILDHADLLAMLVEGFSGFIERGDTITESVVEMVGELKAAAPAEGVLPLSQGAETKSLVDSATRLAATLPRLAPALASAAESGLIERLTGSDILSPAAVDSMSVLARGVVRGLDVDRANPTPVKGPVSMVKALRDDDVARALGFFLSIAKAVGQELRNPTDPTTTSFPAQPYEGKH